MSVLGFGGAAMGNEFGSVEEADAARAVHEALDAGLNFFDTAPYYGRTLAEERLGRALEGRRDEAFLATKCCRYDFRGFDFSAARVHADIDACLNRLRTDRVDLFQIHDIEFGPKEQVLAEALPAMREVQAAGKTRFVGITGLPLEMLRDVAAEFPVDTVLSYCHGSLLVDDLEEVLGPLVRETGMGLLNASPLHMGMLTGAAPPDWHPAPAVVKAVLPAMAEACARRGASLASVGLRYALDHPLVDVTISGMVTSRELAQNLAVLDEPADPELLAELRAIAAPVRNRTWHEGLPENAPSSLRASEPAP